MLSEFRRHIAEALDAAFRAGEESMKTRAADCFDKGSLTEIRISALPILDQQEKEG